MTIRILLDAGHFDKYNQSPVNKQYFESIMNWKLTNMLKEELEKYNGVTVGLTRQTQTKDLEVYKRGALAVNYDLFLSIHSNAAGTESVDYPVVYRAHDNLNNADQLALTLAKNIQRTMGTRQVGRTATRKNSSNGEYYGVLRGARAVGCKLFYILEHSFHTNLRATNWLLSDDNLRQLAINEAKDIAAYYKLSLIETKPVVKPTPTKLYKVQAGAFSVKSNADKLAAELKAKGHQVYIVKVGNLYKVQVGAFSIKSNAEELVSLLRRQGYQAFITS